MEEQTTGSKQVLEGVSEVNEKPSGMNEMASGANQINVAVNHVNVISGKNREGIDSLTREVLRFKVE